RPGELLEALSPILMGWRGEVNAASSDESAARGPCFPPVGQTRANLEISLDLDVVSARVCAIEGRVPWGKAMERVAERRAARRFTMSLPVKIRYSANGTIVEHSGETRDVSFRGLYFLSDAP